MKKLSLLLGTLGGAMAGYLFSNKKLRDELSGAKDAEAAARLLGKHLQHDGKQLAKQVQDFVQSDDVQKNIAKAKTFAKEKMDQAKKELKAVMSVAEKKAAEAAKRAGESAKDGSMKMAKRARKTVRRVSAKVRTIG